MTHPGKIHVARLSHKVDNVVLMLMCNLMVAIATC